MGPLRGLRILEFAGIGPGPFAAMVLANLGADVIRLRRPEEQAPLDLAAVAVDHLGRPALAVDLKTPEGRDLAVRLAARAEAVIEGFRPAVMERLGLGPDVLLAANPALVYARITGYGQDGPKAQEPGHDINYLAVSGALAASARAGERPLFPLNLLADYGGGGMLVALGVLAGVLEARSSGRGQVVDAAMVDGVAQLATVFFGFAADGAWGPPGTNALDSGAPFYEVYRTRDDRFVAVGALEPQFYADLLTVLDIGPESAPQWDTSRWPELKSLFADTIRMRTRDDWVRRAHGHQACLSPVLDFGEVAALSAADPAARPGFGALGGRHLPRAAPRFSRTPTSTEPSVPDPAAALRSWGFSEAEVETLRTAGARD
jgi:alpha-methylacyl-CoA racemase